jgi:hypothetical protein
MTTKINARIRTLLRYDADTGALQWIASPVGGQTEAAVWACLQDRPAGQKKDGKVHVIVDGRSYQAHRIAFQLHLGRWPRGAVSFVNGPISVKMLTARTAKSESAIRTTDQVSAGSDGTNEAANGKRRFGTGAS